MTRYLVTGLGVISSIGLNIDDFWRNMTGGVSGIDTISSFDASNYPIRIAGEVRGFNP
ncbi:MAG: beta-ketoacyl-[acyl-carrier-protein] synthase II, partial [Nitrospiraceae bacterium]|nr:beta-ketoacyl-[acyl-carrier-protein] synthase II [Nitrospiraceae bacterium]